MSTHKFDLEPSEQEAWDALSDFLAKNSGQRMSVEVKIINDQRTPPQNNAIHQWCEDVAKYFNDAGLDMRAVLKPEADIPWTKESVKTMIWHEIQARMFPDAVDKNGKPSTSKLKKDQPSQVEQVIARHFSETRGLTLPPFPSARP